MITLYYKPTCPYCKKVLTAASELGITFDLKNIALDETAASQLIELGGKRQVPYLVDELRAVSMYESEDIIDYLRTHYAGAATAPPAPEDCEACQ